MNVLFIIGAIVLVGLIIKITTLPIKWGIKLLINSAIGFVSLLLINLIGESLGMVIAINPVTVLIAGVLGVPGIAFLILYTYFFV